MSHAGAARFAFNTMLAYVKDGLDNGDRVNWSMYSLRKTWNEMKTTVAVDENGRQWWADNNKESYSYGIECLAKGLKNFSDSRAGRRARGVGFPKFKSKSSTPPKFACTTGRFGLIAGDPKAVRIPRIGRIHCFENVAARVGDGAVTRVTVSRLAGRWSASLTVRDTIEVDERDTGHPVGVDVGVSRLATLSDGSMVDNPRSLQRNLSKLAKKQRALSRTCKGSRRRERAKRQVQKTHRRVVNIRRDAIHKATTVIARRYTDICIEDLNVSGMARNRRLSRSIYDASMSEFHRQLEYKAPRYGSRVHHVDRFYPSSKTCSSCGEVKATLHLGDRVYECASCGLVLDRDVNAAINIVVAGSTPETVNARGGTVRPTVNMTVGKSQGSANQDDSWSSLPQGTDVTQHK